MTCTPKELEAILRKYCIEHSSRRINFLYWNTTDPKDMTLNFVNLTGKELNRVNNGDLVYRIVRVKKAADWQILSSFFSTYIADPDDAKAAYVIRVDYLIAYLKTIKFDVSQFNLGKGRFGSLFFEQEVKRSDGNGMIMQRRHISVVDTDIQSLYLIDKLYTKYRKTLFSDDNDWLILNIMDAYMTQPDFKFEVKDLGITISAVDSLDIVSRKFIDQCKANDPNCRLEQIYMQNGLTAIANRLISTDISILTVRVYIQLFLKRYSKKKGN